MQLNYPNFFARFLSCKLRQALLLGDVSFFARRYFLYMKHEFISVGEARLLTRVFLNLAVVRIYVRAFLSIPFHSRFEHVLRATLVSLFSSLPLPSA